MAKMYDKAHNKRLDASARIMEGFGYIDTLRSYGYELSPEFGGPMNPGAVFDAMQSGGSAGYTWIPDGEQPAPQQTTAPTPQAPVNDLYPSDLYTSTDPPPFVDNIYNVGGEDWDSMQDDITAGSLPPSQQITQPSAIGEARRVNPYVQATDRFGNPIISERDIDDAINASTYGLIGGETDLRQSEIDTGLAENQATRDILPGQTALTMEGIQMNRNLLPQQEATAMATLTAEEKMAPMRVDQLSKEIANLQAKTNLTIEEAKYLAGAQTELTRAQAVQAGAQAKLFGAQSGKINLFTQGQRQVQPGQIEAANMINKALIDRLNAATPEGQKQEIGARRGEATANVYQAFNPQGLRQELGRAGVRGQSGQFTSAMADLAFERSKALAGGRYKATQDVREEAKVDQNRAIQTGVSGIPQYA